MASEPEIIRTQATQRWTGAWALSVPPLAIALFFGLRRGSVAIVVAVVAVGVMWAGKALSMKVTRLELQSDTRTLIYRGLFRTLTLSSGAAPAQVVRVTLIDVSQAAGQIWLGPRSGIMLMTSAWGEDRLSELSRRLELNVSTEPEPVALPELAKRYPGIVPWYAAHPTAAGLGAFVVLMAIILPFAL